MKTKRKDVTRCSVNAKLKQCAKLIDKVHEYLDVVDEETTFNTTGALDAFLRAEDLLNKLSLELLKIYKGK